MSVSLRVCPCEKSRDVTCLYRGRGLSTQTRKTNRRKHRTEAQGGNSMKVSCAANTPHENSPSVADIGISLISRLFIDLSPTSRLIQRLLNGSDYVEK